MKRQSILFACALLTAVASYLAAAPEEVQAQGSKEQRTALDSAKWNVRVEVLMVALPQDRFLSLLPDLREVSKIDVAVAQILADVQKKTAILTGYPILNLLDGQHGTNETTLEHIYPSEFQAPNSSDTPSISSEKVTASPLPASFEKRNLGVDLEVQEVHVGAGGSPVSLDVYPHRVELLGIDTYTVIQSATGQKVEVYQPQVFATRAGATVKVENGQRLLLSSHLLPKPEGYVEIFVLQAFATLTKSPRMPNTYGRCQG